MSSIDHERVLPHILSDYSSRTMNIDNDDHTSSVNDWRKVSYYGKSKLSQFKLNAQWNQAQSIDGRNLEKPSRQKSLFEISEDKDIDLDGYTTKEVEVWERTDTINWLIWAGCKLGQAYGLMSTKFAVPGIKLLRLTKQDFRKYDPHFGAKIYDLLHERCDQKRSLPSYAALEMSSDNETSDDYSGNGSSGVDSDSAEEPRLKRPQLPKFIINLLLDPNYCPEWIRWENYENRSFRFVRNNDVAKLWGMMNNKKNMSYEKLTRAMRYYYDNEVEENGVFAPYPERLVYRFGKKARGFETDNPNFGF